MRRAALRGAVAVRGHRALRDAQMPQKRRDLEVALRGDAPAIQRRDVQQGLNEKISEDGYHMV